MTEQTEVTLEDAIKHIKNLYEQVEVLEAALSEIGKKGLYGSVRDIANNAIYNASVVRLNPGIDLDKERDRK